MGPAAAATRRRGGGSSEEEEGASDEEGSEEEGQEAAEEAGSSGSGGEEGGSGDEGEGSGEAELRVDEVIKAWSEGPFDQTSKVGGDKRDRWAADGGGCLGGRALHLRWEPVQMRPG